MIQDCLWYEESGPDAAGARWIRCRRSQCRNRLYIAGRLDGIHANCEVPVGQVDRPCGTGCHLARIFAWFGVEDTKGCKCKAHARKMDERGPGWCKRRAGRIIGWLRESAKERGLPFVETAARIALSTAIKRAIVDQGKPEAEIMGVGDYLVEQLDWFDDGGLIRRLNLRGTSWAKRRRGRVLQWITAVSAQKSIQISQEAADAALDAAIAKAAMVEPQKPAEAVPVDDPLLTYDSQGQPASGLKNLWRGCAAFLVCGGPSINDLPYHKLAERGVLSLGVNNVCGMVPVKAMTFNDPAEKFHEGVLLDGGIMKLVPKARLKKTAATRRRKPGGGFEWTGKKLPDYPNVWAYERRDWFTPESFLTDPAATFGNNKKGHEKTGRPRIIFTMFLALRLLHFLGVRRVYLLGVDFHMDPAKGLAGNYAFPDDRYADTADPDKAAKEVAGVINGNNDHYRVASGMLTELRPYLEAAGFYVFNCNPWSRLQAFDHVPFEDALADCRNGVPEGPLELNGHYKKGV